LCQKKHRICFYQVVKLKYNASPKHKKVCFFIFGIRNKNWILWKSFWILLWTHRFIFIFLQIMAKMTATFPSTVKTMMVLRTNTFVVSSPSSDLNSKRQKLLLSISVRKIPSWQKTNICQLNWKFFQVKGTISQKLQIQCFWL